MTQIKIAGISKISDAKALNEFGVQLFAFDTRPHSLNFTQAQVIHSILHECTGQFGFLFDGDSSIAKQYFLDQLKKLPNVGKYFLQVDDSDQQVTQDPLIDCIYLDWNKQRYHPQLHANKKFVISFNYQDFSRSDQNYLINTLRPLQVEFTGFSNFLGFEFVMEWGAILPTTISDFFPIHSVCYHISSQVESSFKNLDINTVEDFIKLLSHKYSE
jgi:hypothetical protein